MPHSPMRLTTDRATSSAACVVEAGEEQRELVAAEPERLAALAKAGRDLSEHLVAGRVAVLVVDPLEVVDVEEADGHEPAGLLGACQLPLQSFLKVAVVARGRSADR